MEKIEIKHIFIGVIVVFCCSFLSMCNSCTAKKNTQKIKVELSEAKDSINLLYKDLEKANTELKFLKDNQIDGEDVMQLYLNTAVNSPRTLEQIQKDSVLTKIMKK